MWDWPSQTGKDSIKDEVKAVIKVVMPSTLSHRDSSGRLPIHSFGCFDGQGSVTFVPLLAEEGSKLNVGGEGNRGGLLVEDPEIRRNVLQILTRACPSKDPASDLLYRDILKKLRESNLLFKRKSENMTFFYIHAVQPPTQDSSTFLSGIH